MFCQFLGWSPASSRVGRPQILLGWSPRLLPASSLQVHCNETTLRHLPCLEELQRKCQLAYKKIARDLPKRRPIATPDMGKPPASSRVGRPPVLQGWPPHLRPASLAHMHDNENIIIHVLPVLGLVARQFSDWSPTNSFGMVAA